MKNIVKILRGTAPAPSPGKLQSRGGFVILQSTGALLPEGFPDVITREKTLKESGSVAAFLCGSGQYFCKIYKYRRFFHSLKRTFRTPRAFRCFSGAQLLAEHGFQTPEPVAAAVCYRWIIPRHQLLITRSLPENTVYLDKAVKEADPQTAGELLCAVTVFTAKLHQAGFAHGDMSLRNIYLADNGKSFGLIDLDGMMTYPAGVPRQVAAREIARLISSAYRCSSQPDLPREEWMQSALAAYRESGGENLQKKDIADTLARLEKHRYHQLKKN